MERQAARPVSLKVIWGRRQRHSFQPVLGILTVPLFVLILQTVSKQAAIFLGHVVWGSPHPRMHRRMPLTVISGTNLAMMSVGPVNNRAITECQIEPRRQRSGSQS